MIGAGVHFYIIIHLCDPPKNFNGTLVVDSPFQTLAVDFSSNYRLALPLRASEMLSLLSKSRISYLMHTLLYLSEG